MTPKFVGHYADHRMTSPTEIARYSERIKKMAEDFAKDEILLVATCSRVEFYGEESALRNIPVEVFAGFPFDRIEGAAAIGRRLAEIVSGAQSRILGERNIIQQLENAYKRGDQNLPIFQIARWGVDIGLAARERHQFNASFTYDQFVRAVMADRYKNGETRGHLYLIGASDLCVDLIGSGVGEHFPSTRAVTRNPKEARKRFRRWADKKVDVMHLREFGHAREPWSLAVITTSDLNDQHKTDLQKGLLQLEPCTVVDLMANPEISDALAGKLNCVSMYGEEFHRSIEHNNEQLAPKRLLVCSEIEAAFQTVQIDISAKAR
ncbi:hypothetical protein [Methylobacterium sp. WSM2598]|uniref:hypothetical protein n=1 Tax=Methylobacterium sp. WSM2598 TaxID=398261 RepID=UPI000A0648C5|nr:hypothetical protein [Methylobacterium sp. WSM2598]